MNAVRQVFHAAILAIGAFGFAAKSNGAGLDSPDITANDVCQVECLEAMYDGELIHVFYIDASGKRHHLSTSSRSEEQVDLTGPKAAQISPNVVRFPVLPASEAVKSLGCGIDGYGWDAGEQMWSLMVSNTSGPGGSTRTDARSIYLARGRAMVFTTTTQTPASTGVPTSSTSTTEVPASVKSGTPRGCTQAQ
jgi:hypothetical protein